MAIHLSTVLTPHGPACAIELDEAQVAALGGGKRAPVTVTIKGRTARLRLAVMGGRYLIGLSKAARAELDVEIGAEVDVIVDLDTAPREVEVPADLAAAIAADPGATARWEKLAFTHRKEFAQWIADAKRPQTRARRLEQAIGMLREGINRS